MARLANHSDSHGLIDRVDVFAIILCLVGWSAWLVGRLVGWSVGWLVGRLVGWLVRWLVIWLVARSVGWLVHWLVGWLVGWLFGRRGRNEGREAQKAIAFVKIRVGRSLKLKHSAK